MCKTYSGWDYSTVLSVSQCYLLISFPVLSTNLDVCNFTADIVTILRLLESICSLPVHKERIVIGNFPITLPCNRENGKKVSNLWLWWSFLVRMICFRWMSLCKPHVQKMEGEALASRVDLEFLKILKLQDFCCLAGCYFSRLSSFENKWNLYHATFHT